MAQKHATIMTEAISEGSRNFDHTHRTVHGPEHFASIEMQLLWLGLNPATFRSAAERHSH